MLNHIAIIMDGNGRWAAERGLPRINGHKEGAKAAKKLISNALKQGVQVLTLFAFSTENWSRPEEEVSYLFSYIINNIKESTKELKELEVAFKFIGNRDGLLPEIVRDLDCCEKETSNGKKMLINLAINYGGKWDIVNAAKNICRDVVKNKLSYDEITESSFDEYMSLAGVAKPDLLIRTSGEQRISNFLLWDLAYAELYFTNCYWPDFDNAELQKAIDTYRERSRRYGGV